MSNETQTETNQYLTFRLDNEIFAIRVIQVREVLDINTVTRIPGALDFMRGVINVRGSVVPVVDLGFKFGMKKTENTINSRIIVMELSIDGEETVLGAMADSVHEVMDIDQGQVEEPPSIGTKWSNEFIKGIGKRDDDFIIILDIDRIFSTDDLSLFQEDLKLEKNEA